MKRMMKISKRRKKRNLKRMFVGSHSFLGSLKILLDSLQVNFVCVCVRLFSNYPLRLSHYSFERNMRHNQILSLRRAANCTIISWKASTGYDTVGLKALMQFWQMRWALGKRSSQWSFYTL